jgi:hypothetical protein
VEFVGIPGAGKSTVARRAAELLERDGMVVHLHSHPTAPSPRARHRLLRVAGYLRYLPPFVIMACRHPAYAYRAWAHVAASRQRSAWDLIKVLHNLFRMSLLVEWCRREGGIHLIDQGLFQALWAVEFSAGSRAQNTANGLCDAAVALPDIAVMVSAELPCIQQRLTGRAVAVGRLEVELRSDPTALTRATDAIAMVEHVLRRVRDGRPDVRVVTVGGGPADDLDVEAGRVRDEMSWAARS